MSQTLCFNDFTFSPVTRDNQPWFKSSELARALGYKDENSVRRIYERNADEFTEKMTQVVENLGTVNLTVRVRIFSLRGCHLLAMFARTPVAKAFRRWVLDVIEQYGDRVPVAHPVELDASRPSRRSDPERKALTAIINTWVGMAPIHYASARSQVNAHFGVASVDALTIGQVRDAIQWVQEKIDALQKALPQTALPSQRKIYDEMPYLEFVDEVNSAHMQVQEIQQHLSLKAIKLTLPLCHDIEDRANMPSRVSGHPRCCILESVLLDQINHGISEALTYPSNNLPNSNNPAYLLLGIVRQLNAR